MFATQMLLYKRFNWRIKIIPFKIRIKSKLKKFNIKSSTFVLSETVDPNKEKKLNIHCKHNFSVFKLKKKNHKETTSKRVKWPNRTICEQTGGLIGNRTVASLQRLTWCDNVDDGDDDDDGNDDDDQESDDTAFLFYTKIIQ